MKLLNRFIRLVGLLAIHLYTAVTVYLLALLSTSPIDCIVLAVLDLMNIEVPVHLLYIWLSGSLLAWIPMFISVEIKSHK